MNDNASFSDLTHSSLMARTGLNAGALGGGIFTFECLDHNGKLKWSESHHNLVVNQGLQDMNDKYFAGSAYTAAWYIGLIGGPSGSVTLSPTDTLASHPGWSEFTSYSGARKTAVLSSATLASPSVLSNTASPASFSIVSAGGVVTGAFLTSISSGTSGILFSESIFQAPGDRTVASGDTLNVTYTFSLAAT